MAWEPFLRTCLMKPGSVRYSCCSPTAASSKTFTAKKTTTHSCWRMLGISMEAMQSIGTSSNSRPSS